MEPNNVYTIDGVNNGATEDLGSVLLKAQKGDQEALATLYSASFDKIFRFIYYRVNHLETAEDLTEEVFIKAFNGLTKVKKTASFQPWLYQIARNTVIDYYRSKKEVVDLGEVEDILEHDDGIIDTLSLEADSKILLTLLNELPAEQRIVIKLKFFEELSNPEIAELLHKSEGAVRVIQFRALNKLKELLNNHSL
jgi:RNA polymerase sigma-70 factor, ECF subfamily